MAYWDWLLGTGPILLLKMNDVIPAPFSSPAGAVLDSSGFGRHFNVIGTETAFAFGVPSIIPTVADTAVSRLSAGEIRLPAAAWMSPGKEKTLAFWAKISSGTGYFGYKNNDFYISRDATGIFIQWRASTGGLAQLDANTSIVDGETYLIALGISDALKDTIVYVNGVSVAHYDQPYIYAPLTQDNMRVMGSGNLLLTQQGYALWDRMLSAAEHAEMYAQGIAPPPVAFISPVADEVVSGAAYPVEFGEVLGSDFHELEYWDGAAWQPVATIVGVTPEGTVQYAWNTLLIPDQVNTQLRARGGVT